MWWLAFFIQIHNLLKPAKPMKLADSNRNWTNNVEIMQKEIDWA